MRAPDQERSKREKFGDVYSSGATLICRNSYIVDKPGDDFSCYFAIIKLRLSVSRVTFWIPLKNTVDVSVLSAVLLRLQALLIPSI